MGTPVTAIPSVDSVEELLLTARKSAGWTQQRLAEAVGVTRQHISACERGETPLRLAGVQRLLAPMGLVARLSAEPLAEVTGVRLPMAQRLPAWAQPVLDASPGTMVAGTLALRLFGVPVEVTDIDLRPPIRLASAHPLLPQHTVMPVAFNDLWTFTQREAWTAEHGHLP